MTTPKKSPVAWITADYHPYAQCADPGCAWETSRDHRAYVTRAARAHVRHTGHDVNVTTEKVTTFYAPTPRALKEDQP